MLFALTACDSNDGPIETAGKNVDEITTNMGNRLEDACEYAIKGLGAEDTNCYVRVCKSDGLGVKSRLLSNLRDLSGEFTT